MKFLDPPAAKPLLPAEKIDKEYKRMRLKVFLGAFIGYAAYYLVRKNLSLATPGMIESVENGGLGYTKAELGIAMSAISIAYAFSKFLMGSLSDRSDARKFLVIGLVLSSLIMIAVGVFPFATSSIPIIFCFMLVIGWLSGMGWPPCGRIMVHWFSHNERSFKMSVWNTSHTVGSGSLGLLVTLGVTLFAGTALVTVGGIEQTWRAAFFFPGIIALLLSAFCWWAIRDTPQSCGLPPIDEYRNDKADKKNVTKETKIPFKKLFVDYIFKNKILWLIAFANSFVYLIRYGIGDWAPTYLQEMDIMNEAQSNLAFSVHNYAGVPGTIICGWISAKFFKGRVAPANVIYMGAVLLGVLLYWQAAPVAAFFQGIFGGEMAAVSRVVVYTALIMIGFCIYGPVALIGVQAVNLVPKNAAGTAAGFVGLFGYLIGDAILAKIVMGNMAEQLGWNATFWMMIVASVLAAFFCATTWKREKEAALA